MDEEEGLEVPSNEQLWTDLTMLQGEAKADALSSLAISYSGTENSQYAIVLAEEAIDYYKHQGFDGCEIEFIWIWGTIAESKAKLGDFDEAISAGIKCFELCMSHVYPAYENIRWDLIRWYLEAGRFEEARNHFEELLGRYKFAASLDYSFLDKN